jgi:group I intron endonuclease
MHTEIVAGIYRIRNTVDDKVYVGSSADLHARWCDHWKLLMKGIHRCQPLQSAWDEYGGLFFIFEIIEVVECKEDLIPREQFYLNAAYEANQHYNIRLLLKSKKPKKRLLKAKAVKAKPVVEENPMLVNGMVPIHAAAEELGVCVRRVQTLCKQGRVQGASKVGRDWLIPGPVVVVAGGRQRPGKIELQDSGVTPRAPATSKR